MTDAIERYAARNEQTALDPKGDAWTTKFGGAWQRGARLLLNTESVSSVGELPNRSHYAEECMTYLPAVDTARLPAVVTIVSLPGCNGQGRFDPAYPMCLEVAEVNPICPEKVFPVGAQFQLRGMEAQFLYGLGS